MNCKMLIIRLNKLLAGVLPHFLHSSCELSPYVRQQMFEKKVCKILVWKYFFSLHQINSFHEKMCLENSDITNIDGSGTRNLSYFTFRVLEVPWQVEQGFSSFFAVFDDVSKWNSPTKLWKIIKYAKKLAKNEENPSVDLAKTVTHFSTVLCLWVYRVPDTRV